jgi:acyl-CoA thioesterase-1
MSARPDLRACFIGDSYVAGAGDDTGLGWVGRVVARARSQDFDLTAYNLGVRRDTAADAAARANAELAGRLRLGDRFAVVVAVGTNDVSLGVPLPETLVSVERLIASARACKATAFVLSPPVMGLDAAADAAARGMTGAIGELCARISTPFLDLREAVADWNLWWREAASGDGAHPNGGGYALLAEAVCAWPPWRDWLANA